VSGSNIHIDYPAEGVHWVTSNGDHKRNATADPCPHEHCPHGFTVVVGWGPDRKHYELIVCATQGGCEGQCRGWGSVDEHGAPAGPVAWRRLAPHPLV
jgi:hypothetical protein